MIYTGLKCLTLVIIFSYSNLAICANTLEIIDFQNNRQIKLNNNSIFISKKNKAYNFLNNQTQIYFNVDKNMNLFKSEVKNYYTSLEQINNNIKKSVFTKKEILYSDKKACFDTSILNSELIKNRDYFQDLTDKIDAIESQDGEYVYLKDDKNCINNSGSAAKAEKKIKDYLKTSNKFVICFDKKILNSDDPLNAIDKTSDRYINYQMLLNKFLLIRSNLADATEYIKSPALKFSCISNNKKDKFAYLDSLTTPPTISISPKLISTDKAYTTKPDANNESAGCISTYIHHEFMHASQVLVTNGNHRAVNEAFVTEIENLCPFEGTDKSPETEKKEVNKCLLNNTNADQNSIVLNENMNLIKETTKNKEEQKIETEAPKALNNLVTPEDFIPATAKQYEALIKPIKPGTTIGKTYTVNVDAKPGTPEGDFAAAAKAVFASSQKTADTLNNKALLAYNSVVQPANAAPRLISQNSVSQKVATAALKINTDQEISENPSLNTNNQRIANQQTTTTSTTSPTITTFMETASKTSNTSLKNSSPEINQQTTTASKLNSSVQPSTPPQNKKQNTVVAYNNTQTNTKREPSSYSNSNNSTFILNRAEVITGTQYQQTKSNYTQKNFRNELIKNKTKIIFTNKNGKKVYIGPKNAETTFNDDGTKLFKQKNK